MGIVRQWIFHRFKPINHGSGVIVEKLREDKIAHLLEHITRVARSEICEAAADNKEETAAIYSEISISISMTSIP